MKERVFLSNNQDGIIESYWLMHFLNVTDVLTNRVNCSGSTFNLTFLKSCARLARPILRLINMCYADADASSLNRPLDCTTLHTAEGLHNFSSEQTEALVSEDVHDLDNAFEGFLMEYNSDMWCSAFKGLIRQDALKSKRRRRHIQIHVDMGLSLCKCFDWYTFRVSQRNCGNCWSFSLTDGAVI